ncbi:hypothetical protein G6F70_006095 [Rhizopus microsporus]|nr:hypothetical protein G6F71_007898 [Rhizopus microsporus]KAG1198083.1 hypothetical protein G6F70_006095 [Rhizopus microsporus]KAG1209804.1 hypothetical protein G6F69_006029 [Rhizopus microsporus]KAG1228588.1 hypothetical protein G6F67_007728 [Rhizopus microsporus]KAG1263790.1 hypothetical protein G6F68_004856 [Rhizopus microsporus]
MKVFGISTAIIALAAALAQAQTNSTSSCDPNSCKLPNCLCPSQSPPAGLSPKDVPQFVTITFDDSIQPNLLATAKDLLNVKQGSWYVSMQYTDFALVQQWYANGNEVADHTFTHVGSPSAQEIAAARAMLNQYGGVPLGKIKGFRAPFLNYTTDTLREIAKQGFKYDTSVTAVVDDCYWPYTLDYGLANDCWNNVCGSQLKLPGVWEIPMYAVVDNKNIPQLMDVYLAGTPSDVTTWSQTNFDRHYNGNRQPFGIYVHPTHLTNSPGLPDVSSQKNAVVDFIKSLQGKPDVWFVSNEQLLQWMQNPVPASKLAEQPYMQCNLPNTGKEICNGLETITTNGGVVSGSLLNSCNFNVQNWATCYNCPSTAPTVDNPTPPNTIASSDPKYRHPVPNNCDSIWWDPIAGQCLCSNTTCAYQDTAVPVSTNTSVSSNSTTNGNSSSSSTNSQQAASGKTSDGVKVTNVLGFTITLAIAAVMIL